jgi:hypothetical protein
MAKTVAGSYMRVTMGEWLVWGQISDQTSTKIPLESSDQGLSIGVIKVKLFNCKMILN